ncbi:MAG: dethiobiotin synthase [Tenacibaculum sp.]
MQEKYFITGISTGVGKTIVSAIIVEALEADYWKPIQAGDLKNSDTDKIEKLISNKKSVCHPHAYALSSPMSPHASAKIDKTSIKLGEIKEPKTTNHLVIEGAGGLLVPLNDTNTIVDLIQPNYKVVVVSQHYLGSINHTLLTIKYLQSKYLDIALVYSGDEDHSTETVIQNMTCVPVIGRINKEPYFDTSVIKEYSEIFKQNL